MKPYGYATRKAPGNTTSPNYGKQIITRMRGQAKRGKAGKVSRVSFYTAKFVPNGSQHFCVGAKLAAQYVLRPFCSLEFCLLAALVSQNSIKKHNR